LSAEHVVPAGTERTDIEIAHPRDLDVPHLAV
jgi:hypothetical protein